MDGCNTVYLGVRTDAARTASRWMRNSTRPTRRCSMWRACWTQSRLAFLARTMDTRLCNVLSMHAWFYWLMKDENNFDEWQDTPGIIRDPNEAFVNRSTEYRVTPSRHT